MVKTFAFNYIKGLKLLWEAVFLCRWMFDIQLFRRVDVSRVRFWLASAPSRFCSELSWQLLLGISANRRSRTGPRRQTSCSLPRETIKARLCLASSSNPSLQEDCTSCLAFSQWLTERSSGSLASLADESDNNRTAAPTITAFSWCVLLSTETLPVTLQSCRSGCSLSCCRRAVSASGWQR